jgi:hypothetical protein
MGILARRQCRDKFSRILLCRTRVNKTKGMKAAPATNPERPQWIQ